MAAQAHSHPRQNPVLSCFIFRSSSPWWGNIRVNLLCLFFLGGSTTAQSPQAKLGLIIFHFLRLTLVKPYPSSEHALPIRFRGQCKRTVTPGKTKSNQCSFLRFFSVMKPCPSSEHALLFVSEGSASAQSPQAKPSLIWFRFNEGYSNAVRKSVKVQELLWRGTHRRSFRLLILELFFLYVDVCAYAMYTLHSEACLCLNQRGHLAKRVKSDVENMLRCCEDILPKNCLTYINLWQVFFYPENNSLGWSLQRGSYQRFCLRNVNNSTRMNNEIHSWHFNV